LKHDDWSEHEFYFGNRNIGTAESSGLSGKNCVRVYSGIYRFLREASFHTSSDTLFSSVNTV
jgi:hypothetical protein